MSSELIYSVIPATLLLMMGGLYFSTRKKSFTLADVSSHSLVKSLGLDSSSHSTNSSRTRKSSMDTANYIASDNESIGGRKTRKK